MALTFIEMKVTSFAAPERTESIRLLVDSGAVYLVVPAAILERLGIQPLIEQVFTLANRDQIVRRKGGAVFKYGERIGVADVIFGEEGDANLLGAFTLEALALDPLKRELRELPMMLAQLS